VAAGAELAELRRNEPGTRPLCGAIIGARSPFGRDLGNPVAPEAARRARSREGGGGGGRGNTELLSSFVSVDRPSRKAAPPFLFPEAASVWQLHEILERDGKGREGKGADLAGCALSGPPCRWNQSR